MDQSSAIAACSSISSEQAETVKKFVSIFRDRRVSRTKDDESVEDYTAILHFCTIFSLCFLCVITNILVNGVEHVFSRYLQSNMFLCYMLTYL